MGMHARSAFPVVPESLGEQSRDASGLRHEDGARSKLDLLRTIG